MEQGSRKQARMSLNLTLFESAITSGTLAMAIITPFFTSIGLSQEEIALTQGIFTVVAAVLNIPAGWVADRFSRKWANIIGDFGVFVVHLAYSRVTSMTGAIICESLLGMALALSQGVDSTLVRHFSYKVAAGRSEGEGRKSELAEKFFRQETAKLAFWRYVCTFVLVALGGPIGAIDFRLAIALSGVPSLIGGIASIFIVDDSEKLETAQAPLKDMAKIARSTARNRPLRQRILVCALGREMTHGIIWVVTPLFLSVGVPLQIVSIAWAINSLMSIVGAGLASRYAGRLSERQVFIVPLALMTLSMGSLALSLSIVTVWIYFLMGLVQGWVSATLLPMAQRHIKPEEQTTVISIAKVVEQALYVPAVWLIGRAADVSLRLAPATTVAIFLPLGLLMVEKLNKSRS